MTAEESDESLVARIRKNDHRAFALLVQRHSGKFYGLAWRMTGRSDEAEDIVQDAFLKLWEQPDLYRPEAGARFTTWFYRVVTNLCLDGLRKRRPQAAQEIMDALPDGKASPEALAADGELKAHIETAIKALPAQQRMALNLCFYEGLSNKEAAEIMNIGVKALESLLMRAKSGVRTYMDQQGFLQMEVPHARAGRY